MFRTASICSRASTSSIRVAARAAARSTSNGSGLSRLRAAVRFFEAGSFFVTRGQLESPVQRRSLHPVDRTTGLICDQTVDLTGFYSHQGFEAPLRRIRFKDPETAKTLIFLTINFALARPSQAHGARQNLRAGPKLRRQGPKRRVVVGIERFAKSMTRRARGFAASPSVSKRTPRNPTRQASSIGAVGPQMPRPGNDNRLQQEPGARTVGAPKTHNASQSPGSATIIANTGIRIETPIRSPATKLAASGNLAKGLFITSLGLHAMMPATAKEVGALARLWQGNSPTRLSNSGSNNPPATSVRCRTATAACRWHD